MLLLGIRTDLRHALLCLARLWRRAAFSVYTRAVHWELRLMPDEVEYGD